MTSKIKNRRGMLSRFRGAESRAALRCEFRERFRHFSRRHKVRTRARADCGENLRHDAAGSIPKTGSGSRRASRGIRPARYVPRAARNRAEIKTMNNARPPDSRRRRRKLARDLGETMARTIPRDA